MKQKVLSGLSYPRFVVSMFFSVITRTTLIVFAVLCCFCVPSISFFLV